MKDKIRCVISWDLERMPIFFQEPLEEFYFNDFIEDKVNELTLLLRNGIILPKGTLLEIYSRDLDKAIESRLDVQIFIPNLYKITSYEYRFCSDEPILMVNVVADIKVKPAKRKINNKKN